MNQQKIHIVIIGIELSTFNASAEIIVCISKGQLMSIKITAILNSLVESRL